MPVRHRGVEVEHGGDGTSKASAGKSTTSCRNGRRSLLSEVIGR